jgi:hypothetical protein
MPGRARPSSSDASSPDSGGLTRRELLRAGGVALAAAAFLPRLSLGADAGWQLPTASRVALEKGKLVYVSPLLKTGAESRCHAEVWYFWDRDAVVIATATKRWKARAASAAGARARLWIGDFRSASDADAARKAAPTFVASAAIDSDKATFERLLAAYALRYPEEWAKWKPRFEAERAAGTRSLVRYTPIGA